METDTLSPTPVVSEGPTPEVLAVVEATFKSDLAGATTQEDEQELLRIRSNYFGPKGRVTLLAREVGKLPPEQRREAGKNINELKQRLEAALAEVLGAFEARSRDRALRSARLDMTLPGRAPLPRGAVHPVNRVIQEVTHIFHRLGFEVVSGPEVELDWYNFEALNFPPDHPARDMQDTFFVDPPAGRPSRSVLLRTHTSPVQIRTLKERGVPIRIISPGRVFRCDEDATHSPMFHQVEGLLVDQGVSMAHLKGVLQSFVNSFFGERAMRLRPSFFPFVEPGAEVDIGCVFCDGTGVLKDKEDAPCRVCKGTGWLEILGAGMVHPNVLRACGVDPERYTGFAFGMGIDRIVMLRWQIDDLAHLFRGDVRFLRQF